MTVHFIGAGPGAADLLTIRGQKISPNVQFVFMLGPLFQRRYWPSVQVMQLSLTLHYLTLIVS